MPGDTSAHDLAAEQHSARPCDDLDLGDLIFGGVLEAEYRAGVWRVVEVAQVAACESALAFLGAAAVAQAGES